jgi:nitrogenase molybdenum-iron protein alpha/beta subunit
MTEQYLREFTADYISGVVSACEGIRDSLALINGPVGCKTYYGFAAGRSTVMPSELWRLRGGLQLSNAMGDKLLRSQYFAGSPRIPATNLRYEDFIFGTREQLRRALNDIFTERRYDLFAVIQAPGTSLLGEALEGELEEISREFGIPYLFVETPQFSENLFLGYDAAMVRLLRLLAVPDAEKKAGAETPDRQSLRFLHLCAPPGGRRGGDHAAAGSLRSGRELRCGGRLYRRQSPAHPGGGCQSVLRPGALP